MTSQLPLIKLFTHIPPYCPAYQENQNNWEQISTIFYHPTVYGSSLQNTHVLHGEWNCRGQPLTVYTGACPLSTTQPVTSIGAFAALAHVHQPACKSTFPCCDRTLEKVRLKQERFVLAQPFRSSWSWLDSFQACGEATHLNREAHGSQETKDGLGATVSFKGCIS